MTTVAFDIDGTLYTATDPPVARQEVISLLLAFAAIPGIQVVVWSGGGLEYAQQKVRDLGLPVHIGVAAKKKGLADICFDDLDVKLATVNVKV